MTALVDAIQNVRYGRMALRAKVPDAARYHLFLARQHHGEAFGEALMRLPGTSLKRCDRVLNHINRFALEVLAAAPLRISEMYEAKAVEDSEPEGL